MERLNLWAEKGNGTVQTAGQNSSNNTLVQSSYPGCTVAVYIHGSSNLALIYSDANSTPQANPFTASNNGLAYFYAASGRYDVTFSGNGIGNNNAFTLSDYVLGQIQSINNQTGENITLLVGNSGNNFNIAANNNNITLNLPQANANNNGYLASTDWASFNNATSYNFAAPLVNNNGNVSITLPLTVAHGGTNATNAAAAFDNLSPQTTLGDLISFNNNNVAVRLPVGANNLVLTADATNSTGMKWASTNVNNANGVLPIANGGTNGNNATQAFDNLSPITTKGDLVIGNNNNIAVRLGIGGNNQSLIADASNASGARWGQVDLTAGVTGALPIASGGTSATSKNAAFDALSPANSIGDIITRSNTTGSRLPVGANGQVLTANNANSVGLSWGNVSQVASNYTVSFNNNAFITIGNNVQITLFTLGPFQKITGVTVKPGNLFLNANNSITDVTVSLGVGGNANLYTAAYSIGNNGATGNGNFQDTALWKSSNMGGNTAVLATFLAANNNFGNGVATFLTGGNVTFWVQTTSIQ